MLVGQRSREESCTPAKTQEHDPWRLAAIETARAELGEETRSEVRVSVRGAVPGGLESSSGG